MGEQLLNAKNENLKLITIYLIHRKRKETEDERKIRKEKEKAAGQDG